MAEYHIRWDPTNKKWEVSVDAGAFADLVEKPTLELATFNGVSAPSGIAGKGLLYYDSSLNRFRFRENNGAADAWCRENSYPAAGLDINGLTEDTAPDPTADFLITHDTTAGARKKTKFMPLVMASAYHNTNIVLASGAATLITLNTDLIDPYGFHDPVTNNSRLTVPSGLAGKYIVIGSIRFEGPAAGPVGYRSIRIEKNSAGTVGLADIIASSTLPTHATVSTPTEFQAISAPLDFAVGDYCEMFATHNQGANLNALGGAWGANWNSWHGVGLMMIRVHW